MKYQIIILVFVLSACGGTLSDEQRKALHEKSEQNKIIKVTDSEITEAAFAKGREIVKTIESFEGDSIRIDSLLQKENGRVRWIIPGRTTMHEVEQQLIDAYLAAESGAEQDNVQKIRSNNEEGDSLLYSKPVISQMPDGSDRLEGVWNIWLSKKQLILSMGKK